MFFSYSTYFTLLLICKGLSKQWNNTKAKSRVFLLLLYSLMSEFDFVKTVKQQNSVRTLLTYIYVCVCVCTGVIDILNQTHTTHEPALLTIWPASRTKAVKTQPFFPLQGSIRYQTVIWRHNFTPRVFFSGPCLVFWSLCVLPLKETCKNSPPDGSLNACVRDKGINVDFLNIMKSCVKSFHIQGQMFGFNITNERDFVGFIGYTLNTESTQSGGINNKCFPGQNLNKS